VGPKRGRHYDIAGVLQSGHCWRKASEALSLWCAEQFRQPCEIDCHLSRLIHRHDAGVPRAVRSPAIEHTDLPPGGVLDGKSVRQLDDPPRRRKAGDHVLSAGRRGRLYLGRFGCPGLALLVGATGYGLRPLAAGGLLRLACFLLAKSISRACRRAAIGLERRLPRRRSGPMLAPHCTNTALAVVPIVYSAARLIIPGRGAPRCGGCSW
jgi:hypothetical protein